MELLREWRALSGGAGVPVIAHGNDIIVGFNPSRLEHMLEACRHASEVDADALERDLEGDET